jgi:hypothetical protein
MNIFSYVHFYLEVFRALKFSIMSSGLEDANSMDGLFPLWAHASPTPPFQASYAHSVRN